MTDISFRLWDWSGIPFCLSGHLKLSKTSWSSSTLFLLGFESRKRIYWTTRHFKAVPQRRCLGGGKRKVTTKPSHPALCHWGSSVTTLSLMASLLQHAYLEWHPKPEPTGCRLSLESCKCLSTQQPLKLSETFLLSLRV